jgi:hypothetical protein
MGFLDNISDLAKVAQSKAQEKLKEAADAAQAAKEVRQERIERSKEAEAKDGKPRAEMDAAEAQAAMILARQQMNEPLSSECEQMLQDIVGDDETVIFKLRSSPDGDRSQMVLTNRNLIICAKGIFGGQAQDTGGGLVGALMARGRVSVRIYPLRTIIGYEIQPRKGVTVGHFQVLTAGTTENDNESRFVFETNLAYFKSVLVYRKILELQQATT